MSYTDAYNIVVSKLEGLSKVCRYCDGKLNYSVVDGSLRYAVSNCARCGRRRKLLAVKT